MLQTNTPSTADIKIICIAESFFLNTILKKKYRAETAARTIIAAQPGVNVPLSEIPMFLSNNVVPVAKIKAATTGFTPRIKPLKNLFSVKFFKIAAINTIIIKEGKTTPKVAQKLPNKPPCSEPIYVAILIATGPGVDSQIPIRL